MYFVAFVAGFSLISISSSFLLLGKKVNLPLILNIVGILLLVFGIEFSQIQDNYKFFLSIFSAIVAYFVMGPIMTVIIRFKNKSNKAE